MQVPRGCKSDVKAHTLSNKERVLTRSPVDDLVRLLAEAVRGLLVAHDDDLVPPIPERRERVRKVLVASSAVETQVSRGRGGGEDAERTR